MKRWMIMVTMVTVAALSLACVAFSGAGGSTKPSGDFQITVDNKSPDEICYVFISESESQEWGDDRLGGEETIASGASKTFDVSAGQHDVQLETCDEVVMGTAWAVDKKTTLTAGERGATSRLLVDNTSDQELCYVFISLSSGGEWGDDRMGGSEIIPAGGKRIFYVKPGTYDLMVQNCDDESLAERYEVDLTTDKTWTLSNE
ncbi:MAG TPA: hypothetical protein PKZ84_13625 [Anaerolineae bacterium]|nr:hypothetical protein [Anaerolineae bacterium]HQI85841.1 hypothetical protein [Anaerolineae bacterium]